MGGNNVWSLVSDGAWPGGPPCQSCGRGGCWSCQTHCADAGRAGGRASPASGSLCILLCLRASYWPNPKERQSVREPGCQLVRTGLLGPRAEQSRQWAWGIKGKLAATTFLYVFSSHSKQSRWMVEKTGNLTRCFECFLESDSLAISNLLVITELGGPGTCTHLFDPQDNNGICLCTGNVQVLC